MWRNSEYGVHGYRSYLISDVIIVGVSSVIRAVKILPAIRLNIVDWVLSTFDSFAAPQIENLSN